MDEQRDASRRKLCYQYFARSHKTRSTNYLRNPGTVLKTVGAQAPGGSNPLPSATLLMAPGCTARHGEAHSASNRRSAGEQGHTAREAKFPFRGTQRHTEAPSGAQNARISARSGGCEHGRLASTRADSPRSTSASEGRRLQCYVGAGPSRATTIAEGGLMSLFRPT